MPLLCFEPCAVDLDQLVQCVHCARIFVVVDGWSWTFNMFFLLFVPARGYKSYCLSSADCRQDHDTFVVLSVYYDHFFYCRYALFIRSSCHLKLRRESTPCSLFIIKVPVAKYCSATNVSINLMDKSSGQNIV